MKHYIFLSFLCLLSVWSNTAEALAGGVSGKVADAVGKPLSFANVLVFQNGDSTLVKTELTDGKGEFLITPLVAGHYNLKVVLMGYGSYQSGDFEVNDHLVVLPGIVLEPNTKLKEVTVSVQTPFIEVKADKLVVNVANSITVPVVLSWKY